MFQPKYHIIMDIWSYFCALQHKWTWAETSKVHTVYNRLETTSCTLWLFSHQLGLVTLRTITIYTLSIEQILKHGYPFRKLNSTGVCKEDEGSMNLVKTISVSDPSLCFKWMEKDLFSLLKFKVKTLIIFNLKFLWQI